MTKTFQDALTIVMREEGGYSNDPRDPGGITNLGVTARAWQAWTGKPATEPVMRALTRPDVMPFYHDLYWAKVAGDQMPVALALVAFDFGVNEGPKTAIKLLQAVIGAPKDGLPGQGTVRALQAYIASVGLEKLIVKFCDVQRNHYRELPGFLHDGQGWLNRVADVQKEALTWIG